MSSHPHSPAETSSTSAQQPLVPSLSVLDLLPVRTGQTTAQAMTSTLELVGAADRLGFTRYWFAEHHNMPAIAASSPPVMIAAATARTERIRLGSGGVMLPNHAPLIVAEQFAALEALAPGRIDLGIGRAPGSDPVITALLRSSGPTADVEQFPQHVREVIALMSPEGATAQIPGRGGARETYTVHATPAAVGSPDVWLLGSSDYSASLAAVLGLPYVFAYHFAGPNLERVLSLYRDNYEPSERFPEPRTFLTVNTVVAPTQAEAEERALPHLRQMARLRTPAPQRPQETVEEALATPLDGVAEQALDAMRPRWVIAEPHRAAETLTQLARTHGVDEVMLVPVAGSYESEPLDSTPGRLQTLELLARALRQEMAPTAT
ncbi:luciferase family oxidoreductase group 1 [Georgenia soli]|uniref:Luciferase family oxidoreductase group 1 n=1 Tax=Georgenia soli TaxID=638953 RepID=A0A2A9EP05_9MICO|nr:LLM class flavin-dependent oxidoreductase [Georgenia soli]PFG39975.1 luciferase family oxidoreductase group 1 [Georgenia soli]